MSDITTKHVAEMLNLSKGGIYNRQVKLNLLNCVWTQENIEKITNYKTVRAKVNPKVKLFIIEYFLSHQINTYKEIAESLGCTEYTVNKTITEWLENDKSIFVDSKLNKK